jgi:hypothetical protein
VNCLGSSSTILNALTCSIPILTLRTTPYSLPWGTSVYAKVTAMNAYGSSV